MTTFADSTPTWVRHLFGAADELRTAEADARRNAEHKPSSAERFAFIAGMLEGRTQGVYDRLKAWVLPAPQPTWTLGEVRHYLREDMHEAMAEVLSALVETGPSVVDWTDERAPCEHCEREPGAHEAWCETLRAEDGGAS